MDKLKIEYALINRIIWCDLIKTYQKLIECKSCIYRDNCKYRKYGLGEMNR
jgi:hypothetical protein